MNYRHVYHAGNFTDVVKHIAIIALLKTFLRKTSPFCYLDTHAGNGYYDLFSEFANKTKEYANGIEKIIQKEKPPALIKEYLFCIHQINNQLTQSKYAALHYYPGSPLIARHFLRPRDHIIACELQLEVYQDLKKTFAGDKQVSTHHMDGFLGLKSFLPPKERRGLVLIDPPYEDPAEFIRIAQSLSIAIKKWETGSYCIWYPIKEKNSITRFYRALKSINHPVIIVELSIFPDIAQHLNGCGLAIINPPWHFSESIEEILPWLWKTLTINQQGGYSCYLLK